MNKNNEIILCAILILLMGAISSDSEIMLQRVDYSIEYNITDYHKIMDIAKNISSREYIEGVYDCSDMSNDLTIALRNNGYKTKYIRGKGIRSYDCNDCNISRYDCINGVCWGGHAWVRVWIGEKNFDIESTTGLFIFPFEYFNEYKEG